LTEAIGDVIVPEIDLVRARMIMTGFDGDLVLPADPAYHELRKSWNSMIDRRPAAIAPCRQVSDVQAALRYARQEGLEVAVRGGGHSVSGLSSTDDGIQIDLRPMNRIEVDPVARRARVQGGALIRDLDRETHSFGLATTGGLVSHTGVGGLTLGGGYGALARRHGLACDNLVSVEIVTAEGGVVRTTESENPELLWALRGGGGNFGIVTEFEFRLHPVEWIVSGSMEFDIDRGPQLFRAYRDVAADADRRYLSAFDFSGGRAARPGSGEPVLSPPAVGLWYTFVGSDLESGAAFADALRKVAKPLQEDAQVKAYPSMQAEGDEGSMRPGRRQYWKASLLWELSDRMIDAFFERGERLVGTPCWQEVVSLGGAISDIGEGDTAYSNRDAAFDLIVGASWDDPEEDQLTMSLCRETWRLMTPFSSGVYVNNLGEDAEERVAEAYGASKLERLVAVKDRWDPANVFHLNANIKPSAS
jgi:FAD/FMN-containing dehydrogenase